MIMDGLIFFFQAEDGIRDLNVTGVQTCALPIWVKTFAAPYFIDSCHRPPLFYFVAQYRFPLRVEYIPAGSFGPLTYSYYPGANGPGVGRLSRSEERRVGKACRCQRLRCGQKR